MCVRAWHDFLDILRIYGLTQELAANNVTIGAYFVLIIIAKKKKKMIAALILFLDYFWPNSYKKGYVLCPQIHQKHACNLTMYLLEYYYRYTISSLDIKLYLPCWEEPIYVTPHN